MATVSGSSPGVSSPLARNVEVWNDMILGSGSKNAKTGLIPRDDVRSSSSLSLASSGLERVTETSDCLNDAEGAVEASSSGNCKVSDFRRFPAMLFFMAFVIQVCRMADGRETTGESKLDALVLTCIVLALLLSLLFTTSGRLFLGRQLSSMATCCRSKCVSGANESTVPVKQGNVDGRLVTTV